MTLWDRFATLPRPSAPGCYSVEPGSQRFRVGRSYENHPAVLIEFATQGGTSAPRRLATIAYMPPTVVDLASGDGSHHTARLAVLECRTTDAELAAYFFRIAGSILLDNVDAANEAAFEGALDSLVTLFRSLQRPGERTVQGLWAELAVILWSADPTFALSSWHSSPHALHDFSAGTFRLEVKGTLKELREHMFLLDQLATFHPGVTMIASVLLQEAEDGASVFDLVASIVERTGGLHGPAARLETIVAESLGSGWRDAADLRFSLDGARRSLQVYAATDVPTVPQPLPPEVKDVRFVVDLSGTPDIDLPRARTLGALFQRLLPSEGPKP